MRPEVIDQMSVRRTSTISSSSSKDIDKTRRLYDSDFETFLVNNILLSVVFFENYNDDLKILSKNSVREQEIAEKRKQFERKHNMSLIYPDTLFENMNKHIAFQRRDDKIATSLVPERIFVVDKTVRIHDQTMGLSPSTMNDVNNDDTQVALVPSEGRLGYVLLQNNIFRRITFASTSTSSGHSSRSLGSMNSYEELVLVRTKEPLGDIDSDLVGRKKPIFKAVRTSPYRPSFSSSESGSIDPTDSKYREYMSSRNHAVNFKESFKKQIGFSLGLDPKKLPKDDYMRATFYCKSYRSDNVVNYEITPVLDINWPDNMSWLRRARNETVDPSNHSHTWPSDKNRNEMQEEQCVIIPRYAIQKYKPNVDKEIEWEVAFPRADKYLQRTMSHAQTKTYLVLALLHRSFIEPHTQYKGLLLEHMRMIFYWELEQGYVLFPETRMGTKVISILRHLYDSMRHRQLNHYFYGKDQNVFDGIPDQHLITALNQIDAILNNKVAYFMAAVCNLRYTSKDAMPRFDLDKLHKILTDDNYLFERDRPATNLKSPGRLKKTRENLNEAASYPKEWIDLTVPCRVGSNQTIRKEHSLKMFIEHFIEVGKVCISRSNPQLARVYLSQARDLNTILEEQGHHKIEVRKYKESIYLAIADL